MLGKYIKKFDKTDKFFLLGYNNASFDDQFLRGFFLQNQDDYFGSWFWADPLDVRILAARQFGPIRHTMPNFQLKTVARQIGIEVDESRLHDAVYDVELTYAIYTKLRLTKQELESAITDFQREQEQKDIEEAAQHFDILLSKVTASKKGLDQELIDLCTGSLDKLKGILKPVLASIILFLFLATVPMESYGQFRDKKQEIVWCGLVDRLGNRSG